MARKGNTGAMENESRNENVACSDEPPLTADDDHRSALGRAPAVVDRLTRLRRDAQWNDWRWQIRNRIRSIEALKDLIPELDEESAVASVARKYPLAITPYYASLIRTPDMSDPIFSLAVPQPRELCDPEFLDPDPLEEEKDMPVPGFVHRYADRGLLIATTMCAMYCRHCTRKRVAGTREVSISVPRLREVTEYLRAHPEIHDVIISGGDPLTMPTSLIERILMMIRSVPSVQIVRLGTRTPVVLPQRITEELTQMLRKYHPLWINTHFNHPNEITPESAAACARLVDAGIPLGNQSVLLRGVNDSPQVMEELCRALVRIRVRPYYLFQCDLVRGVEHFRTPISRGIEVMEYLRGRLSGLAIPTFVVDTPHGGGKIPLLPNYVVSMSPTHTVLRNYEGMLVNYPEPTDYRPGVETRPAPHSGNGVWELAAGHASAIVPADAHQQKRRSSRRTQPAPESLANQIEFDGF